MCQIDFTIQYNDAEGDSLQAAEGRYKLQSAGTFQPVFSVNLSNPQTPNLNVNGVYDLEIRVQDTGGLWSIWFATTFEIADDCSPQPAPYVIGVGDCDTRLSTITTTNVWIDISTGSASIVDTPDRIYTDAAMTVPYVNTGTTKTAHRIGVNDTEGVLWIDKSFTLSSTTPEGTIIGSTECTTSGGVLSINSSIPTGSGTGTLDFRNGEPGEVINLSFSGTFPSGTSIDFSSPVNVALLDSLHTSRNGTVTLNSSGEATSNYNTDSGVSLTVTITGRSSSETDGIGLATGINN